MLSGRNWRLLPIVQTHDVKAAANAVAMLKVLLSSVRCVCVNRTEEVADVSGRRPSEIQLHGFPTARIAVVLPSWISSFVVHALVVLLFVSGLKSCQHDASFGDDGELRNVGIYIKQPSESRQPEAESAETAEDDESADVREQFRIPDTTAETTPVKLQLPTEAIPTIAPGSLSSEFAPGDVQNLLKPNGFTPTNLSTGTALGATSFIGIEDSAKKFVYVIDASASMSDYQAILVAKAELLSSLESLEGTQQFQIIFYNSQPHVMSLDSVQQELFYASDVNRTLARQFVNSIRPDGGTLHFPALRKALRFNPEVVYFLTDAAQPQLDAKQLSQIQRLNKGGARIHCIEFGIRAQLRDRRLSTANFLQKLASQNDGQYRYVNVTQLIRR